jgi:hypothetical protein
MGSTLLRALLIPALFDWLVPRSPQRSADYTAADLAEIEVRQRESAKVIARLAAAETLEQQEQLAESFARGSTPGFADATGSRPYAGPGRARRLAHRSGTARGPEAPAGLVLAGPRHRAPVLTPTQTLTGPGKPGH